MPNERELTWDGSYNARDLGGLPTRDGRTVRWREIVRSASPALLTAEGWTAVHDYGIRTIIDLTDADEAWPDSSTRPSDLTTVRIPLDPTDDEEFWGYWGTGLHGTPLYFRPFLDRFPQRIAEVLRAITGAEPGGVLVHCSAGRDRTGLVTLMLLATAGVTLDDIVTDFRLSTERLRPMFARLGMTDQEPMIDAMLAEHNSAPRKAIAAALDSLDPDTYLRSGGLTEAEITTLRSRIVEAPPG